MTFILNTMCIKFNLLLILIFITGFSNIDSRGSRGGGSRGGGSRSSSSGGYRSSSGSRSGSSYRSSSGSRIGDSRSSVNIRIGSSSRSSSGYRSGSYGRIGVSSRYSSWSRYNGYSPTFRYKYTSYKNKRVGVMTGLIIINPHRRHSFPIYKDSAYDDISICYNEYSLYDRNITATPWFVCPWDDMSNRFCCGDEIQEYCCKYFDRPGHLAGLIIGLLILVGIVIGCCICCCRRHKNKYHKDGAVILTMDSDSEKQNKDEYPMVTPNNVPYPPSYPSNNVSPPYPMQPEPNEQYSLNPMPGSHEVVNLPYPVTNLPMPQPEYPSQYSNPMSNDGTSPQYPLIPSVPEVPPPSYSDLSQHGKN